MPPLPWFQVCAYSKFPFYRRNFRDFYSTRKNVKGKTFTDSRRCETFSILAVVICMGCDELPISAVDCCNIDVRTRCWCVHNYREQCAGCYNIHYVLVRARSCWVYSKSEVEPRLIEPKITLSTLKLTIFCLDQYIISFLFKTPSSCNMFIIVFNFFIGLAGSMVVLILRLIYLVTILNGGTSNLKFIAQIIEWILR